MTKRDEQKQVEPEFTITGQHINPLPQRNTMPKNTIQKRVPPAVANLRNHVKLEKIISMLQDLDTEIKDIRKELNDLKK